MRLNLLHIVSSLTVTLFLSNGAAAQVPPNINVLPLLQYYRDLAASQSIGANGVDHINPTSFDELGCVDTTYKYTYLGVIAYVLENTAPGTYPLYRATSVVNGDHILLTDPNAEMPGLPTYTLEGIEGYVYTSAVVGTVPLYRFWNGNQDVWDHAVATTSSAYPGYTLEGVLGYVYPGPADGGTPCGKPSVSGPSSAWWFSGTSPSGWITSATLTSGTQSSTTWTIVSGSSKATLSTTTGAHTTVMSTGTSFSSSVGDVIIRAIGPGGSTDFAMSMRRPYRLLQGATQYNCDPTFVYQTSIGYQIIDQLGFPLPGSVPINEQWITGFMKDYRGTNWATTSITPGSATTLPDATFADNIQGDYPTLRPTPVCDSSNATLVLHWGQSWRVGSLTIGSGAVVQTDTIQKMIGKAAHLNIVSPVP
jgi:hypothetical protein